MRRLRALNPVSIFFGAIFDKEVRVSGRRPATYLGRMVYVALLLLVLGILVLDLRDSMTAGGPAERMQALSSVAPVMAVAIGWTQFIFLALLAPSITAPSMCDERLKRTLPSLATTPLTSVQIVFGKLTARMLNVFIIALIPAPLLLLLRVFGGLETEVVVAMSCLALSSAMFTGSLGLLFALWRRRATGAVMLGVFGMVLLCVAPLLTLWVMSQGGWGVGMADFERFVVISAQFNPVLAMAMATAAALEGHVMMPISLTRVWVSSCLTLLGLALIACVIASFALRRVMLVQAAGGEAGPTKGRRLLPRRRARANRTRSREVSDNPVLWRELRASILGGSRLRWIAVGISVLIVGVVYYRVDPREPDLHIALTLVVALAQLSFAAVATSGVIAGERDARTWSVLMTTPLRPRDILLGKTLGAMRGLMIMPALIAAHFTVFAVVGYVHWFAAVFVPLLLIGFTIMLVCTGVMWSLLLRKAANVGVVNLALALAVWAIAPLLITIFMEVAYHRTTDKTRDLVNHTLRVTNPVAMTLNVAGEAHIRFGRGSMTGPSMTDLRSSERRLLAEAGAASLGGATIGAGAMLIALGLFRRRCGRSS